jgi:zona occludens toxin
MALSIYVGPPGSGKTYNAVESVAVPAAKAGRTILTNIKGIDPELWSQELGCDPEKIIVVDEDWFRDEAHYPVLSNKELLLGGIPNGALVLIDEAYTVFPTDSGAVTARQIEWVRTHRHFVSDDGIATDLVLISQDVMSIHPRVRSVVEYVSAVRNLRHIGMGKRFRVDVFSSWRMNKGTAVGQTFHRYDKAIFRLYKSFEATGAAKVVMTDKKQRAIKPKHLIFLACAVGLLIYAATRVRTAVSALDASAIGKSSAAIATEPRDFSGDLPCAAVGGVIIDIRKQEGFFNGNWQKVQVMGDGSWRLGDVCSFDPGVGSGNGSPGSPRP